MINSAAAQWTCQVYQVRTYVEKTCKSQNNEVKLLSWDDFLLRNQGNLPPLQRWNWYGKQLKNTLCHQESNLLSQVYLPSGTAFWTKVLWHLMASDLECSLLGVSCHLWNKRRTPPVPPLFLSETLSYICFENLEEKGGAGSNPALTGSIDGATLAAPTQIRKTIPAECWAVCCLPWNYRQQPVGSIGTSPQNRTRGSNTDSRTVRQPTLIPLTIKLQV